MSGDEVPRVSRQDIQLVQNLIERCLQLYMNQKEVVETLLDQAKIEPGFTELVWQKLEEENQEFFKAYRLRLMIKQQIIVFNKLLGRQVEMMRQSSGVPSTIPLSNGTLPSTAHMNAAYYGLQHGCMPLKEEALRHPMSSPIPSTFNNTVSSTRSSTPVYSLGRGMGHSNAGGSFHEVMVKEEVGYGGTPPFVFGGDESVLDTRQDGETSGDPLAGMLEPLNDPLPLDTDPSSFGFLGQIPRNFSLSDLTADFSQSSDILESYPRSPFLHSEPDNLLDPSQGEEDKLLDTISEGLSYEELGSD